MSGGAASAPPDAPPDPTSKREALRTALRNGGPTFLLEAHNGLSARIVQEAGFGSIWASGLTMSANLGVRDASEASWSQVVDLVEAMVEVTDIPVVVDGDTGHGSFNNARRFARKLELRGAAGVCLEDKHFPKTNSLQRGATHQLADVAEFCGRLAACRDALRDPTFVLIARIEALIAGRDVAEALRRAEAYVEAGADAVFIHATEADPILDFARAFGHRAPVVVAPTAYDHVSVDTLRDAGVSAVIWANHLLRAATRAMQATAARLKDTGAATSVADALAPVDEIFRLQNTAELQQATRRYAPPAKAPSDRDD